MLLVYNPSKLFFVSSNQTLNSVMRKLLPLLMLVTISQYIFGQTPAFITDSLDSYIRQGMKDWNVPGLAIVIVKDGQVAFMKGYGVADTATRQPVNENTLFMIASNTKLFTATAISQLEYDKKLSLDDKFTKYFPGFTLYEPTTTSLLTIRDLLSHRMSPCTSVCGRSGSVSRSLRRSPRSLRACRNYTAEPREGVRASGGTRLRTCRPTVSV